MNLSFLPVIPIISAINKKSIGLLIHFNGIFYYTLGESPECLDALTVRVGIGEELFFL